MREKQALEVQNAQLRQDITNIRTSSTAEAQRLTDLLTQARAALATCNDDKNTLQVQLVNVRNKNQAQSQLQTELNACNENLRL